MAGHVPVTTRTSLRGGTDGIPAPLPYGRRMHAGLIRPRTHVHRRARQGPRKSQPSEHGPQAGERMVMLKKLVALTGAAALSLTMVAPGIARVAPAVDAPA